MLYYNQSINSVLKELDADYSGLPASEASERIKIHGLNEISVKKDPLWRKLVEPFANVFMLVLFIAALISFWHRSFVDGSIILLIMAVSATIYYIQRFSTERILRSLQKHSEQKVDVLRDGQYISIDSSQIVPGDIIRLKEGDKIPADARIVEAQNARVDESLLTGESVPISKQIETLGGTKEIYEQSNMLFQGSFIISGEAVAVVVTTGNNTEFGKIAALSRKTEITSPVQQKIDKLISQIVAVVAGLAVVVFSLSLFRGTEFTEALQFVLAVSVSAVPESLPVAISIILVLGMRRMAARKALVRNMRAIESIGVITTVATDKTGTLTQNKLTIQEIWQPEFVKEKIAHIAGLTANVSKDKTYDPLDIAIIDYIKLKDKSFKPKQPLKILPFDQAFSMSGNLFKKESAFEIYIKGAPEAVVNISDLTEAEREEAEQKLQTLTAAGYRVIALASTKTKKPIAEFGELNKKHRLDFKGFIALADILRPEAKHAIKTALEAGVTVRMVTGDHFETAYHIGKQLGMVESRDQVFDSRRMHTMSDTDLRKVINDIRVFSRVIPENKFRILTLLKEKNITAMTGDGVNDVPALTNAHVGVAMGAGSAIAKDAGDIILLDNNFKSIIEAMKEGRIILSNMRRMLFYLLSTNAGEALTMIGALVIGMPVPLLPVQILWINLVTDTSMVIPLGLEPGEKDIMKRKPGRPDAPILDKLLISRMVLVALSMSSMSLILYFIFSEKYGHAYASTIVFCALVVVQWANAFNARSDYQSLFGRLKVWNSKFYIGLAIAVTLQLMVLLGPLKDALHVSDVAWSDLLITGVIAFMSPIILVEIHKFISRRWFS